MMMRARKENSNTHSKNRLGTHFRSLGNKIKTNVAVRTKAKNWRLSFSASMRAHGLRSNIRTSYETVGKIHRKLKCDLSEMNDYLWPRETLRYEIYSIKTLIVIIETLVMIISYSILIYLAFKYNMIFYNFKMKFLTLSWSLWKKINCTEQCTITEPKTIQKLQRGFPDIRGLKLSYHVRWILEICFKRTPHRLLEHDMDHKTFAV